MASLDRPVGAAPARHGPFPPAQASASTRASGRHRPAAPPPEPSPSRQPGRDWSSEPAIVAIIERAGRLSPDEILGLAHDRRRAGRSPRVISNATSRPGRLASAREVSAAVAAAVYAAARGARAERRLASLGVLFDASLAATDAALAVLLADQLSPDRAASLRAPWTRLERAARGPS